MSGPSLNEIQWKALWEASRELDALLTLEELMPVVNRILVDTLGCECTSLLVVDAEADALRPYLAVGRSGENVREILWNPGRGVAGRVLSRNMAERVNDAASDPDGDFTVEKSLGVRVRNMVAAPLDRGGVAVGVIEAVNKKGGDFSEYDLELLRLLAFDIASAVDNARTYEREIRERSENETLYRVASRMARSLTLDDVLEDILDAVAEIVHYQAAAIYILNRDDANTIEQLTMRGYDPARKNTLMIKLGTGIVGWVCQTGRGVIIPNVEKDARYVNARETTRSEMAAPLLNGRKVIGAFNLESDKQNAFQDRDLRLLEAFASHAALSIVRAQLHDELKEKQRLERELSIARDIQRSFQPARSPELRGFDIAGVNEASEQVGGDYYDFIQITEGHLGIAVADISGKGIPAALIMASYRASLIAEIRNNYAIRTVLAKVNRLLVQSLEPGRFVTAFYGVLDVDERRLTWANAGHNHPILLRASGKLEELRSSGTILGSFSDAVFKERTTELRPGDLLLIYTDGLVEARSPEAEEFGTQRVEGQLRALADRPSEEIIAGLLHALREFVGFKDVGDDVTLVVLKCL